MAKRKQIRDKWKAWRKEQLAENRRQKAIRFAKAGETQTNANEKTAE